MRLIAQVVGAVFSLVAVSCAASATGGAEPAGSNEQAGAADLADPSVSAAESAAAPTISFVPADGCDGIGGTWRGQASSEPHGAYYDFTFQFAPRGAGRPELTGSMLVRSWEGNAGDINPPEGCGDHYHWTVLEDAVGRVSASGSVRFEGTSWSPGENPCGEPVTNYSLDRIDALPAAGRSGEVTRMSGSLSDHVVWKEGGLPIDFTRTACL